MKKKLDPDVIVDEFNKTEWRLMFSSGWENPRARGTFGLEFPDYNETESCILCTPGLKDPYLPMPYSRHVLVHYWSDWSRKDENILCKRHTTEMLAEIGWGGPAVSKKMIRDKDYSLFLSSKFHRLI